MSRGAPPTDDAPAGPGPYRTQRYVERSAERCVCDAPPTRACRCCRRPRCRDHLARGLCDRCGQALRRELPGLRLRTASTAAGTAFVLFGVVRERYDPIALAGAAVLWVSIVAVVHWRGGARVLRRLAPALATTGGGLPPGLPTDERPRARP